MALWEEDNITIESSEKLFLIQYSGPLLKKLEAQGYINRNRSKMDERNVYISLTKKGTDFQDEALIIPEKLVCNLGLDLETGKHLLDELHQLMKKFIVIEEDK